MLSDNEVPPSGENIFLRKRDPNFLLVFCGHFASISNHFRVIQDLFIRYLHE
jgi:hypothetical protein